MKYRNVNVSLPAAASAVSTDSWDSGPKGDVDEEVENFMVAKSPVDFRQQGLLGLPSKANRIHKHFLIKHFLWVYFMYGFITDTYYVNLC